MNHTWKKLALFAGGVLFGTAGIDILKSRDAKKLYTHTTAAVLRAKDCVMTTVTRDGSPFCPFYNGGTTP